MNRFHKSYRDLYDLPKMRDLMRYELKQELKIYKLIHELHKQEEIASELVDN